MSTVEFGPSSRAGGFINDSTAVNFVFIRHAQATHNVAADIYGEIAYMDPAHHDALLTDEGHLQTARVRREHRAEFLGPDGALVPTAVYCSPLQRCRQTLLEVIPDSETWLVHLDDRLMEPQSHICNHRAERNEIANDCPSVWRTDDVAEVNPKYGCDSIVEHIHAFTAEMLERHPGQRILVVAHFTWIQKWFSIFKQKRVEPPNCGILQAVLPVAAPHKKLD